MICQRCGGSNPEECIYCRHCGQHLTRPSVPPRESKRPPAPELNLSPRPVATSPQRAQVSCPRCGAPNSSDLRYCSVCGTSLPRSAPSAHAGSPHPVQLGSGAAAEANPSPPPATSATTDKGLGAGLATALGPPSQPTPSLCWNCRSSAPPGAAFCQACGADLRGPGVSSNRPLVVGPPPARLIVIAQDGTPGREYPIPDGQIDIGRNEGGVLLTNDTYVCPRHARIQWKDGCFWASDLGSVNGVYARLRAPEPLHHGSLVLLGLEVLRFELVRPAEQAQSPAIDRGTHVFGSPAAPRYARLVQRTVEGISRNVYYLSKSRTTLGREIGDVVFTEDPFMSRQHAAVTREHESFFISDLGSSNGTFLSVRDERPLADGDHVRIGQHLFRLHVDDPS